MTIWLPQGDPPDNMKRFWRFMLRKGLSPDSLSAVQFSVFGLGDSNYPKYNVTAKKLFRRLESLGARPLVPLGLGNDQHPAGYEAALDPWALSLWPVARQAAGPLPHGVPPPTIDAASLVQLGEPKYKITLLPPHSPMPSAAVATAGAPPPAQAPQAAEWAEAVAMAASFRRVAATASGCPPQGPPPCQDSTHAAQSGVDGGANQGHTTVYGPWCPYFARMLRNQRITASSHFQDTRHIELDLGDSGLTYEPGDVLAVLPRTPPPAVDALLKRLGLDGSQRVCVEPAEHNAATAAAAAAGQPVVACGTVRALVQGALDIAGASPRRYFFQVLQNFARTELEQERLAYFATAEGRDDLYRYNQKEGRTVLEVLSDFKTATPTLEWFLEACPPLAPRLFSISSSLKQHPRQAHLTVAVVDYTTPFKRRKRGLCSSYLAASKPLFHDRISTTTFTTIGAGDGVHSGLGQLQPASTNSQHLVSVGSQSLQQNDASSCAQVSGLGPIDGASAGVHQQQCMTSVVGSSHQSLDTSGGMERKKFEQQQEALLGLGRGALASHGSFSGALQQACGNAHLSGRCCANSDGSHAYSNGHPITTSSGNSAGPGATEDTSVAVRGSPPEEGKMHVSKAAQLGNGFDHVPAQLGIGAEHGAAQLGNSVDHVAGQLGNGAERVAAQLGDGVEHVAVWVERGALRMPPPHVPLILIGPGTGVAPFRAMLEERQAQAQAAHASEEAAKGAQGPPLPSGTPAPCSLFFGCRSRAADFYYGQQWHELQDEGVLLPPPHGLVVAFSRDQASKVYVTHKLREHAAHVWSLISGSGASIFVSGSAQQMPANVVSALEDVAQEQGGMGKEEASKFVRQLELTGRFCVEAWS
ncbi:hypothetical protein DUNSADRAFT_512 [Dunaliella salina]|uniref:NADPH-dependent diflavin oxidoreductase 1 n=1 Tax=Dunaliella salina TaxID=3046 RepID=A0ABQ7GY54_DUNSA|nr:hypothetical protein DUNSADRAFT_512 [Dunaliella salina]|eukprot:KAF5839539.1 hypothetical protein DUNSADRAFT_512 [Dunaliella salina]